MQGVRIPLPRLLIAVASVAGALAVGSMANGVTFGAKIDARTANNTSYSCRYPAWADLGYGFGPVYDTGAPNCDVFGAGALPTSSDPASTESTLVPLPDPAAAGVTETTGTITLVRVKTGAMPGPVPARLAIFRSVRAVNGRDVACCTGKAVSATVTLQPNKVNNLVTDLRVSSKVQDGYYSFDTLVLTMLDPVAPIPAELSDPNALIPYLSSIYVPTVGVGEERFTSGISAPIRPLIQAELSVDRVGGSGNGGGGGGAGAAPSIVPGARAKVANGRAAVPVMCPPGAVCVGNLVLANKRLRGANASAARAALVRYGSARYQIAGGASASVSVRLVGKGRTLLRSSRSVTVWANMTPTGGATKATRVRLTR